MKRISNGILVAAYLVCAALTLCGVFAMKTGLGLAGVMTGVALQLVVAVAIDRNNRPRSSEEVDE